MIITVDKLCQAQCIITKTPSRTIVRFARIQWWEVLSLLSLNFECFDGREHCSSRKKKSQKTKILTMLRDHTPGKLRLIHYIIFRLYFVLSRNLFLTGWLKFAGDWVRQRCLLCCPVDPFKLNKKWNIFLIFLLRGVFCPFSCKRCLIGGVCVLIKLKLFGCKHKHRMLPLHWNLNSVICREADDTLLKTTKTKKQYRTLPFKKRVAKWTG